MTSEPSVVCTKCGFLNQAGDQFCGSCGAFLEWEGSPVGGAVGGPRDGPQPSNLVPGAGPDAAPGVAPAWGGAGTSALAPQAPEAADARSPAGRAPTPAGPGPVAGPSPAVGASADAGLVRCPACGVANAAARTFCQSCGTRLAAAARVAPRSRDEIAAAVAAVPRAPAPQPGPGAAPTALATARQAAPARSGGLPLWIAGVVAAGILVGAGVIVLPGLLRGSGPVSAATAVASAALSPSAGAAASASASAAASPSTKPSPAVPKPLHLTAASASSVVNGDTAKYGPANAIDGNPKTSWQEGSPTEKGQWLEVGFAPSTVNAVQISNGYDASTALYKGNQRLKDVQISIDGGDPISVRLKDTPNPQRIDLPATPGATRLRITIVSTYPSAKTSVPGTPFDDAALNEVVVLGVAGS